MNAAIQANARWKKMRRLLTVRSFRTEISIKIIITNWHYHHDDHHLACTSHAHLFDVWVWVWLNKKVKSENAGRYARDHPNCDCECMYILHRFATINVQAASLYPSHSHHVASPLAQNSPALRSHRQFIALQTNEIKKLRECSPLHQRRCVGIVGQNDL